MGWGAYTIGKTKQASAELQTRKNSNVLSADGCATMNDEQWAN